MQTNAFHVIKDLLRTERLLRYDVPSGLVAYAAQCSKKQPRKSAEAAAGVCDYGSLELTSGRPAMLSISS